MEDITSIFEKVPFGERGWIKGKFEKDTPIEAKIATLLHSWVSISTKGKALELKKYEKLFQLAKLKYPKYFSSPIGKKAYRGLSLDDSKVNKFFKEYPSTKWKMVKYKGRRFFTLDKLFNYSGNKVVDSWSTSFDIAESFSMNDDMNVIMETEIDNSFIFSPKLMDNINGDDESEVLSFKQNRKVKIYVRI